jgi:hypothetical protein
MNNEHDITKEILSIIRKKRVINEELDDSTKLEGGERDTEVNKIKEAVAARIKITEDTPIVYPYNDNVVIRGSFGELEFEMSANDGLFITTSSLKISDNDIVEIIRKLEGYYGVWRDEWADKIQDYKKGLK